VIVVDASAATAALLNDGPARHALANEQLHAPHLIDVEVASGLRRAVLAGTIPAEAGKAALGVMGNLAFTRYPVVGLLDRLWELRDDVSAYDACYLALAETLGCALLTADARLSRAAGIDCVVTVVPR